MSASLLLDIIADPSSLGGVPVKRIPPLLSQLAALQGMLAARLAEQALAEEQPSTNLGDRLLTVDEAAERLGMSKDSIYRRAAKLPFVLRISARRLRCSEKGIEKFIRERQRS